MYLNDFGQIAYNEWAALEQRFPNFSLDVFQIMPNHMHGIIFLTSTMARTDGADISPDDEKGTAVKADPTGVTSTNMITIGDIVGAYKSIVNNKCLNLCKAQSKQMGKLWQRNYYEIIIRNELAYRNISQYILNNPQKWDVDKFYRQ
jgi:putative transposase